MLGEKGEPAQVVEHAVRHVYHFYPPQQQKLQQEELQSRFAVVRNKDGAFVGKAFHRTITELLKLRTIGVLRRHLRAGRFGKHDGRSSVQLLSQLHRHVLCPAGVAEIRVDRNNPRHLHCKAMLAEVALKLCRHLRCQEMLRGIRAIVAANAEAIFGMRRQPFYLGGNIFGTVRSDEKSHLAVGKIVFDAAVGRADDGQAECEGFKHGGRHTFAKGRQEVKVACFVGLPLALAVDRAFKRHAVAQTDFLHISFHLLHRRRVFAAATNGEREVGDFFPSKGESVDCLEDAFGTVDAGEIKDIFQCSTAPAIIITLQKAIIHHRGTQQHGHADSHGPQLLAEVAAKHVDERAFAKHPAHHTRRSNATLGKLAVPAVKPRRNLAAKGSRQKKIRAVTHELVGAERWIDDHNVGAVGQQQPHVDQQIGQQAKRGGNARPLPVASIAHLGGPMRLQAFVVERHATR